MPGPNSQPKAKDPGGHVVTGKTTLKRRGLKSGQGIKAAQAEKKTT